MKSSRDTERVRQPVHGDGMHITAVGFLRFLAGSGEETDLLHGKRKRLPLDPLAARSLVVENRVLSDDDSSAKRIRQKRCARHRPGSRHELSARESAKAGHGFPSLKSFPSSRPYNRFHVETWHCHVSTGASQIICLRPTIPTHFPGGFTAQFCPKPSS